MEIKQCTLEDLYLIQPKVFEDKRGYFFESYNYYSFLEKTGNDCQFIQDNESHSEKGTLRGLHFQKPPFAQAKLIRVISGEILDVVVDLRSDSSTFGQWESYLLSESNKQQLFVPRGFAHGFIVLSSTATVLYKVDNKYTPSSESGIRFDDSDLKIDWQYNHEKVILSEKDTRLPSFKDYKTDLIF